MRKWITTTLILFILGISSIVFGSYLFSLSMQTTDNNVKQFGFLLSVSLLILGLILIVLMNRYSNQYEWHTSKYILSKDKKYIMSSINWFYFAMILLAIMGNLLIFGLIFFPLDESYWRLYNAFFVVAIAMIVSYVPWFEVLKRKMWSASWFPLFVIFMVLIIILILQYVFYLYS